MRQANASHFRNARYGRAGSRSDVFIGVCVEHVLGVGRRLCEGIAASTNAHGEWNVALFEDGLPAVGECKNCVGFIWDVTDARTAEALVSTGKPVIDMVNDGKYPGTFSVGADHVACGELAARHFMSRHFSNFAFCGWHGLRFSDAREQSFVEALERVGYECRIYRSHGETMHRYVARNVLRERFVPPADASAMRRWLRSLPKPVGVFCANDLRAWQVCDQCRRSGLAVPDDVAVLGADNDMVPCNFSSPPISSVDTNAFDIGRTAAEVLRRLLVGELSATQFKPVKIKPRGIDTRASTAIYPIDPPWLSDALSYICGNVEMGLTASDVAQHVGLSYGTIESAFRDKLGSTVQREIMAARMEIASWLLKSTDLSLSEIAVRSGFRSAQYFCNSFKLNFGASPSVWREQCCG